MNEGEELAKLRQLMSEHERSAQMLVRRDMELSHANERLRQLDRMKSEFVSVAAHQLRTPLSAVKWALKLLIDGDVGELTPEQKSILMKGYESNERMIQLIDDLLNLDRIESGKVTYAFVPIRITDLIENLIIELTSKAEKHGVKLKLERGEGEIPMVDADNDKLRGVFQNLIDNAVKYTMPGGSVTVSIAMSAGGVVIGVSDTGIGVPKEQQRQLFSKFFRGTNAVRVEPGGSGLGLFISQRIVERHGGKIWFESKEGKGTTFYVQLPKSKSTISQLYSRT